MLLADYGLSSTLQDILRSARLLVPDNGVPCRMRCCSGEADSTSSCPRSLHLPFYVLLRCVFPDRMYHLHFPLFSLSLSPIHLSIAILLHTCIQKSRACTHLMTMVIDHGRRCVSIVGLARRLGPGATCDCYHLSLRLSSEAHSFAPPALLVLWHTLFLCTSQARAFGSMLLWKFKLL